MGVEIRATDSVEENQMTTPEETKICPICGKKMIKRYHNHDYPTSPVQYPWYWWCGCGNTEQGGVDRGKTDKEIAREEWKEINEAE